MPFWGWIVISFLVALLIIIVIGLCYICIAADNALTRQQNKIVDLRHQKAEIQEKLRVKYKAHHVTARRLGLARKRMREFLKNMEVV